MGFSRTVVGTARAAISNLRKEKFDLTFLDLQLPDAPGEEVCQRARQMNPELQVIVVRITWRARSIAFFKLAARLRF